MKKTYIQPQTIDVRLDGGTIMKQFEAGSDAPEGAWGVPARGQKVTILYV